MKPVLKFEIIDHGLEHEQYFSGCGTALTEYSTVATGIGSNLREALEDAAEQLAEQDIQIPDDLDNEINDSVADAPESEETHTDCGDEGCFSEGIHYYASIRVKL